MGAQEDKKHEALQQEESDELKQQQLSQLLDAYRAQLAPVREDVAMLFQEADTLGVGLVDYETFANVLRNLPQVGASISNTDVDLLMECFFDPDASDQARPMSIAVLDEALFR